MVLCWYRSRLHYREWHRVAASTSAIAVNISMATPLVKALACQSSVPTDCVKTKSRARSRSLVANTRKRHYVSLSTTVATTTLTSMLQTCCCCSFIPPPFKSEHYKHTTTFRPIQFHHRTLISIVFCCLRLTLTVKTHRLLLQFTESLLFDCHAFGFVRVKQF